MGFLMHPSWCWILYGHISTPGDPVHFMFGSNRLVDRVVVGELYTSPVHLMTDEVLIQQTSLFPCRFPPEAVDRPVLDERLNVNPV